MDTWFIKTSGQDFYKCVIFKHLAAKKAEFIGLTPGPHHIKLAIAATDLRNSEWGGAAFIAYGIPLLVIGAVVGLCIAVYLTRKIWASAKQGPGAKLAALSRTIGRSG